MVCFRALPSAISILGLFSAIAYSQAPRMDSILYGASYYHEYMPYERLEQDVQLMEKAGITVVRLGESSWGSFEPREGEFSFDWMQRILDRLHRAGIKVIFGTPTYSIPLWLYHKHPEVLVTRLGEQKSYYGPRQNMDITNPTYLFYAERIIRQILSHFKDHPAIIGYQIDNETGSYETAGRNVQVGFVDYLKRQFKTTAELNKRWGLAYWGQLVSDWDEFPARDGILNPGYKLEWERYQQKLTTDFLAWQAAIVNQYKRPGQFITQNFVGGVRTDIDEYEIAKSLDISAVNPYHDVQDDLDGLGIALSGDLCRSLKQNNYLITETNAQAIGWDSKWQRPPYDGQLRLNVYSHLSHGANMVAYWHWHSLHYGQETYWKGVLSHDLEPNRVYREVSRTAQELKLVGPRLVNLKKNNKVAILYSVDSYQGIRFMPFHDKVDYLSILHQLYRTLFRMNVGVDFVFPQSRNFSDYSVIVVPPLYIASDDLLARLSSYAGNGGHLLLTLKSGFCDEFSTVRWERMPGPLRKICGFSYQEFSSLKGNLSLKGDPLKAGDENKVSVWAEMLMPETAAAVAYYDHPFFGKYPAITKNETGKGTVTYEGTVLSDQLQEKVLAGILQSAGLIGPDQKLPDSVRAQHGVGNSGKLLHYYLNYSSQPQSFAYPYAGGADLLTGKTIAKAQNLTIGPWDLLIVEER
ncbi:MAG TPA: beta-galactosidase [Acidobacteriota bacterium]|nr:beta-galactosidase [Acidobacteriota bacterium]